MPEKYEDMVGAVKAINAIQYRRDFKGVTRNADGIPLKYEETVEHIALVLADAYESLYDARKAALKEHGISPSQLDRDDIGNLISVNLAACVSVPVFVQALEEGGRGIFAVMVLHWFRAHKEFEWIFSHLAEAVSAYYRIEKLRLEMNENPSSEEAFDDLRMQLQEALYHYNHRHC